MKRTVDRLGVPTHFTEEVLRSGGIATLTLRPKNEAGQMQIFGGNVTLDGSTTVSAARYGERYVAAMRLPRILGFCVKFNQSPLDVEERFPAFSEVLMPPGNTTTTLELPPSPIGFLEVGDERRMILSAFGLAYLARNAENKALGKTLTDIHSQMFGRA